MMPAAVIGFGSGLLSDGLPRQPTKSHSRLLQERPTRPTALPIASCVSL